MFFFSCVSVQVRLKKKKRKKLHKYCYVRVHVECNIFFIMKKDDWPIGYILYTAIFILNLMTMLSFYCFPVQGIRVHLVGVF